MAFLAATRVLLLSTPVLLAFFFFVLAATLFGPCCFFFAPTLFRLPGFALSPFFGIGLRALLGQLFLAPASLLLLSLASLLLLLAPTLFGPCCFFFAPALFRFRGFTQGLFFRLGFRALLC